MKFSDFVKNTKGWRRKDFLEWLEYIDMWEEEEGISIFVGAVKKGLPDGGQGAGCNYRQVNGTDIAFNVVAGMQEDKSHVMTQAVWGGGESMARMVFSVSLSPQDVVLLDDIASRQTRGNRSALISSLLRQSVLNQYKNTELTHVVEDEEFRNYRGEGKCNPMHVDGKCLICWGE